MLLCPPPRRELALCRKPAPPAAPCALVSEAGRAPHTRVSLSVCGSVPGGPVAPVQAHALQHGLHL